MAILKACEILASNNALMGKKITIASDSKTVVSWLNNNDFGSLAHLNLLYNIRGLLHSLGDVEVCYFQRSSNSFADKLVLCSLLFWCVTGQPLVFWVLGFFWAVLGVVVVIHYFQDWFQ